MIVIKNYLSTSQVPLPQLMLIKNLAYITKRKPLDHTDGNLLSNLKTVPSTDLLKVRMAACGQTQTLQQFQIGNPSVVSTTGNPAIIPSQGD